MDQKHYNVLKHTYYPALDTFEIDFQTIAGERKTVEVSSYCWYIINGKQATWAEFYNIMRRVGPSNMYNFCVKPNSDVVKFYYEESNVIEEETNMRKIIDVITNPDPMTVTLCVENDGAGLKYAEMNIISDTKIDINGKPVAFRDFYLLCREDSRWVKNVTFIDGTIERDSPFNGACDHVVIRISTDIFKENRSVFKEDNKPYTDSPIKKVIFNPPATIIFWRDGTKTIVKTRDDEDFDHEKGFAMAVAKKYFGTRYGWHKRHFLDAMAESLDNNSEKKE